MILVDAREPEKVKRAIQAQAVVAGLTDLPIVRRLTTGDFIICDDCGHSLVVERKATNDFLSSLGSSGRWNKQKKRLLAGTFSRAVLVLEGPMMTAPIGGPSYVYTTNPGSGIASGWQYPSIVGILMSIQSAGMWLLPTHGVTETARAVIALAQRAEKGCILYPPKSER